MSVRIRMIGLWLLISLAVILVPSGYAQREPAVSPKLAEVIKAAQAEGELNLVAGGGTWGEAEGVKVIQDALNKKYGLNVTIRYAPGHPSMAVIANRMIEMYKAGLKSDTDLFVGASTHMAVILKSGVARPFPWREAFPHVPEETVEFEGQIIRFAQVYPGITYNTREITGKDVPRRFEDVLNPRWKGKIASTPFAASLYYLASDRVWGYEKTRAFVQALSRQVAGLIGCGEPARIASGEFLMLVMNCGSYTPENYARKTGAPIGAIIPEDAPVVMTSYYYVVPKNSAHPNLATLLVGFLMSKEGQDILYRMVGWSSPDIEGTQANRQYKEMKAKGINIQKFTAASYMGEEGSALEKAGTEFRKILAGR